MQIGYDHEDDVLHVSAAPSEDGSSLAYHDWIAVLIGSDNGTDVVGLIVRGASGCLPQGYDPVTDTVLLGITTDDSAMITTNGDFLSYWQPDEHDPIAPPDPIGIVIRQASQHFGGLPFPPFNASL